jgi:hypothetical protein
MGTGSSFPGGKAAWAWSWPFPTIYCWGQEMWSYTSTPPYFFMAYCLINLSLVARRTFWQP